MKQYVRTLLNHSTRDKVPNWPTYYNAAPTTALRVVRQAKVGGGRELGLMQWGLIPWISKDGKLSYSPAASYPSHSRRVAASSQRRDTLSGPDRRTIDNRITSGVRTVSQWRSLACGIA